MDSAARHAEYADVRFVSRRSERLSTRNGLLDGLDYSESEGIGVRVRRGGAWGFAAARGGERADAEAALARALSLTERQPRGSGAALTPEAPATGRYESPLERDPFAVSAADKLGVLAAADAGLRTAPNVALTLARFEAVRTHTVFASTEGALCEQRLTECGGGISAVAVE
jgi:TldD protein